MTIGIVCNVYQEASALPGWLRMAEWFDDVFIYHTSPGKKPSNDGTMELIEESGHRYALGDINKGFGVIRSELIQRSKADWVLIADADERFYPKCPEYQCEGSEFYPVNNPPNLKITAGQVYDQGSVLREMVNGASEETMCIRLCRRHWFDDPENAILTNPAQNWNQIQDWQLRLIRNSPFVFFDPVRKLHEHLKDSRSWNDQSWTEPKWISGNLNKGPFFDHFHNHFKPLLPEKNKEDLETYNAMSPDLVGGMWLESAAMTQSTEICENDPIKIEEITSDPIKIRSFEETIDWKKESQTIPKKKSIKRKNKL